MPRSLPPDPQTCDRQADALPGGLDAMITLPIVHQQRRGPVRGAIAQLTRVLVDDLSDQRVDDPQRRGRTAGAGGIPEARPEIEVLAHPESIRPVVNRLTTAVEQFGDVLDRLPLGEPEQGLCPAAFLSQGGMSEEFLQLASQSVAHAQDDVAHRATPRFLW